jgi:hypothetical protein
MHGEIDPVPLALLPDGGPEHVEHVPESASLVLAGHTLRHRDTLGPDPGRDRDRVAVTRLLGKLRNVKRLPHSPRFVPVSGYYGKPKYDLATSTTTRYHPNLRALCDTDTDTQG